jgi:hypothetical protein
MTCAIQISCMHAGDVDNAQHREQMSIEYPGSISIENPSSNHDDESEVEDDEYFIFAGRGNATVTDAS